MRICEQALLAAICIGACQAFAPTTRFTRPASSFTKRSFGLDPSAFQDVASHAQHVFSSFSIADAATADAVDALPDVSALADRVTEAVSSAPQAIDTAVSSVPAVVNSAPAPSVDSVQAASDAALEAADTAVDNGWFGFLTVPIIGILQLLHGGLVSVGLNGNSWGVSIIVLTLFIKLATFPLTKTQLESTNKMQALQPKVKDIQAKYQSNPEVMNQKMAELYQTNQVNPLAGCIPSLAQIPIFIGLYRAVLDLAKENKLNESFLWLPSLQGPVYGAGPAEANSWLFNWIDGAPALGWDDTLAFLVLPVFLVVSQVVSMELMTPKDQQQQGNFILKLLPLMIGYFSLGVPSALSLYWVTNNIVTTATSLYIRNSMKTAPAAVSSSTTESPPAPTEIFAPPPMREKPAGFAAPDTSSESTDGVKPITAIDAEIESVATEAVTEGAPKSSKRGSKKKRKKN